MNGKGCTGEADQTSKAGQFWRLRRTWKKLYAVFSSLSYWKPVQFSQERSSVSSCRCLENESGRKILIKHSEVCRSAVGAFLTRESYSSQDVAIPGM